MGGPKSGCLVRVRWRNTKKETINLGKPFLNVASEEFVWDGARSAQPPNCRPRFLAPGDREGKGFLSRWC